MLQRHHTSETPGTSLLGWWNASPTNRLDLESSGYIERMARVSKGRDVFWIVLISDELHLEKETTVICRKRQLLHQPYNNHLSIKAIFKGCVVAFQDLIESHDWNVISVLFLLRTQVNWSWLVKSSRKRYFMPTTWVPVTRHNKAPGGNRKFMNSSCLFG